MYFTEEKFRELTRLLIEKVHEWKYQAILNLQTRHLVNPVSGLHDPILVLLSPDANLEVGDNPIKLGHFLMLAGFILDERGNVYFILRDTMLGIGYLGYHI